MPDDMIKTEISNIKKYNIVSQAELVTDSSLMYYTGSFEPIRGTLRIIYYPPTDEAYLEEMGLEVGKWYEQDVEVWMAITSDGPAEYRNRWETSFLVNPVMRQKGELRLMK